jgi:AraC-like DNA-binding protein
MSARDDHRPRLTSALPGAAARAAWYPPDPRLAAAIAGYWTLDVDAPPATLSVIPDGLIDLTFELELEARGPGAAWVTGPRTEPATYTHPRAIHLLGVGLQPGAARRVLRASAAALTVEWQPLAPLLGDAAAELVALIAAAPDTASRVATLEAFLAARLAAHDGDGRVAAAVDAIVATDGDVDVEALGRRAGASPRNLGRLFDDWVGMSPKRFARVARVQAAVRRLAAAPDIDLAALAAELGFADHAHLTRELRALTGEAPRALAGRLRSLSDSFKR